jgi:uncharacterized protein (TIGR02466 family)
MIHVYFPTLFYIEQNVISDEENNFLINELFEIKQKNKQGGSNWASNVYNTCGTFNLHEHKSFKNLNNVVSHHTNNFAKILKSNYNYECKESWFNFYNKGDYQEYHTHSYSVFSAVYYFLSSENSGKIIFENPTEPDMCSLKNVNEFDNLNSNTCYFKPPTKSLLIFRSNIRHMVEKNNSDEMRITGAFNLS